MFERTGKQQQTNRMNQCNNKMFDDKMYKMITSANTHTIQMKFGLKMLSNNYQRIDACTSNFVEKKLCQNSNEPGRKMCAHSTEIMVFPENS